MRISIDLTPLHGRKQTGVELCAIDLYKALLTTNHSIIPIFMPATIGIRSIKQMLNLKLEKF